MQCLKDMNKSPERFHDLFTAIKRISPFGYFYRPKLQISLPFHIP